MATEPTAQRVYRAACPNCGAPVEFRSAASAFAVCSFCKSTVVREGDALRKIGQSAELFEDHSPLQLGASGRYQSAPFTLVGRLQYRYAEGTWNEWHALFEAASSDPASQKSGWLSEDNGRYVISFEAPLEGAVPPSADLRAGAQTELAQQRWSIASVVVAKLIAGQGELPYLPSLERAFVVADLRNSRGEVGTLDYSGTPLARWSIGRSVALGELSLQGLADSAAEKTLKGRSLECPNCGAALEVRLSTTQSIVCHQCQSVLDVSKGVGDDVRHYAQQTGGEPQLALGSTGQLALGSAQPLAWQVVGYVERCEVAESDQRDDFHEQSFWREYLLYRRSEGFAFIVDAEDGWSWTTPVTGVPEGDATVVKYQGEVYRELYRYVGMVTYVLGEFYWQVAKNQRTFNRDFQGSGAASAKRLNREQTREGDVEEVVWSAGQTLPADAIIKAFGLAPAQSLAIGRDALPTTFNSLSLAVKVVIWVLLMIAVLLLVRCSLGGRGGGGCEGTRAAFGPGSAEYRDCLNGTRSGGGLRTGGGAFGGFSSGGSHK